MDIIWSGPAGRNLLKKKITFFILPVFLQNILTPEARKHLEIFVKSSRKLLQQHNIGIYEKKKIMQKSQKIFPSLILCNIKDYPYLCTAFKKCTNMVAVVQLVRASDCGSECRGFESLQSPKKKRNFSDDFPLFFIIGTFIKYYKISQLIHTQSIANSVGFRKSVSL